MKSMRICLAVALSFAWLALPGDVSTARTKPKGPQPPDKPTSYYEKRELRGWTLRVHKDLLADEHAKLLADVLAEMDNHLYRIERVVPAEAVRKLKKVVLWVEYDNPKGRHAHYHPAVGWL